MDQDKLAAIAEELSTPPYEQSPTLEAYCREQTVEEYGPNFVGEDAINYYNSVRDEVLSNLEPTEPGADEVTPESPFEGDSDDSSESDSGVEPEEDEDAIPGSGDEGEDSETVVSPEEEEAAVAEEEIPAHEPEEDRTPEDQDPNPKVTRGSIQTTS